MSHATHRIGECEITVGLSWVVTRWPDGVELHAHPNYDAESLARAEALGYGQGEGAVDAMTRDHDVLHTRIAVELGLPHSPTLRAVATGAPLDTGLADYEERVVLARQQHDLMCAAGHRTRARMEGEWLLPCGCISHIAGTEALVLAGVEPEAALKFHQEDVPEQDRPDTAGRPRASTPARGVSGRDLGSLGG